MNRERARYTRIKADKEELKLGQMRGELVKADDVRKAWADMSANVKKKLLALEARLPGLLNGRDMAGMSSAVHDEVRQVLSELSEESPL